MECVVSIDRARIDFQKAQQEVVRLKVILHHAEAHVVKLGHYIELAALYELTDDADPDSKPQSGSSLVMGSIQIITERGVRQPTRLLVEELERRGYSIGGQNKVTNLSGTLSRSPELTASRTEGWGLKVWESRTTGPAAETEPPENDETPGWDDLEWDPPDEEDRDPSDLG